MVHHKSHRLTPTYRPSDVVNTKGTLVTPKYTPSHNYGGVGAHLHTLPIVSRQCSRTFDDERSQAFASDQPRWLARKVSGEGSLQQVSSCDLSASLLY